MQNAITKKFIKGFVYSRILLICILYNMCSWFPLVKFLVTATVH